MQAITHDFAVRDEGTLVLLWALTDDTEAWIEEHLPADRLTWGHATVIEHRYAGDVVDGLVEDGLTGRAA
jgi:hypothetical protein